MSEKNTTQRMPLGNVQSDWLLPDYFPRTKTYVFSPSVGLLMFFCLFVSRISQSTCSSLTKLDQLVVVAVVFAGTKSDVPLVGFSSVEILDRKINPYWRWLCSRTTKLNTVTSGQIQSRLQCSQCPRRGSAVTRWSRSTKLLYAMPG